MGFGLMVQGSRGLGDSALMIQGFGQFWGFRVDGSVVLGLRI